MSIEDIALEDCIAVCATEHKFEAGIPEQSIFFMKDYSSGEAGSDKKYFEELLMARGMKIQNFKHYVGRKHTIIGFLKKDLWNFIYVQGGSRRRIRKRNIERNSAWDFKMQHDFDFIWEKGSIYSGKYCEVCEELA